MGLNDFVFIGKEIPASFVCQVKRYRIKNITEKNVIVFPA
jgi:hypothetical protein